jgi:hypothetical protein
MLTAPTETRFFLGLTFYFDIFVLIFSPVFRLIFPLIFVVLNLILVFTEVSQGGIPVAAAI